MFQCFCFVYLWLVQSFNKKSITCWSVLKYDLYIYFTAKCNRISLLHPVGVTLLSQLSTWMRSSRDKLYSEMLLTDRFLSSHRLQWLCLFLGCGLGQWLVLNARCFTVRGCTQPVGDCGSPAEGDVVSMASLEFFLLTKERI